MKKERLFYFSLTGVLLIILFFKGCGDKPLNSEKIKYKYNTDTITIYKDKEIIKTIKRLTPPKVVTEYNYIKDTFLIYTEPDTIWVISSNGKDTIGLHESFLGKHPNSSKLITFYLNRDTLDITTLNKDANLTSRKYPMDFRHYKYQWYDNELHHKKIKDFKSYKSTFNQLYINSGYSWFLQKPFVGVDYSIPLKKFKLSGAADITIEENPSLLINAKLGYRLLK